MSQMEKFAEAVYAYAQGREPRFYPGEHTKAVALAVVADCPWAKDDKGELGWFCMNRMIAWQKKDMGVFGVEFDTWGHESDCHLHPAEKVRRQWCAQGLIFKEASPGRPICGNCATPLEVLAESQYKPGEIGSCHPCPVCSA